MARMRPQAGPRIEASVATINSLKIVDDVKKNISGISDDVLAHIHALIPSFEADANRVYAERFREVAVESPTLTAAETGEEAGRFTADKVFGPFMKMGHQLVPNSEFLNKIAGVAISVGDATKPPDLDKHFALAMAGYRSEQIERELSSSEYTALLGRAFLGVISKGGLAKKRKDKGKLDRNLKRLGSLSQEVEKNY